MPHRVPITLYMLALAFSAITLQAFSAHGDQAAQARTSAGVTLVLTNQQAAWNKGDVDVFMSGYWDSPDLTFLGSSGVSRGWEGILARYRGAYPDRATMGQLDFSDLEVRPLGEKSALVLGKWHLKRTSGDIGGVFTLVFQQFPEGWKIVHDHTSQVLPKNP